MNAPTPTLAPATELARRSAWTIPGESDAYRAARTALLAEEIELRRHIEAVAAQRRALPPGAAIDPTRYRFEAEDGTLTDLAGLFGDKATLVAYSAMYGPDRAQPCPMCTNLVGAWDGNAQDVDQQASLVFIARAPMAKLKAWKRDRGWQHARLYRDLTDAYSIDWKGVSPDRTEDWAAINVFRKDGAEVRHFWSGEMGPESVDPGQDGRGAPDPAALWTILDMTPEGRPDGWYPKLSY
ncbi:DUF899 family protein [Phenylobacterium sp. J367]|uniref:DUF899 family protein n=1 Tax=Phenylobacterium sp. J367 TaxID=2898435 RepID=UPI002150B953|nr:DUF899 family protein [Phenylobacterium sp. J367]MCR5878366.1 DUF899 family protein [Phenylobacterium sp. J367]